MNILIEQIAWAIGANRTRELALWQRVREVAKDRGGQVTLSLEEREDLTRSCGLTGKSFDTLVDWYWLGRRDDTFFLRSNKKLAIKFKFKSHRTVRFNGDYDHFKEWAFAVYTLRLALWLKYQARKACKSVRDIRCRHIGGVSLSKIAQFLGKSKTWAVKMKKRAAAAGYISCENRFIPVGVKPSEKLLVKKYNPEEGKRLVQRRGKMYEQLTDMWVWNI